LKEKGLYENPKSRFYLDRITGSHRDHCPFDGDSYTCFEQGSGSCQAGGLFQPGKTGWRGDDSLRIGP
jgi:hypothetical protein